jgi:hypothetical protein
MMIIMAEEKNSNQLEAWKGFLKKHWKMALVIVAGIACAFIGAIFVFLWRTIGPVALASYPATLDLWTLNYLVSLVLDLLLWLFLLIALPVIAAAIVLYFLWWNKFPEEDKRAYMQSSKDTNNSKKMKRGGGGAFNILITITWLIIVYADGKWNAPFGTWTFAYLINSVLATFLWDLLILGIPATIALVVWLLREMKK